MSLRNRVYSIPAFSSLRRTYCAARGFEPAREYIDVGQSGPKESRPELNKLMEDARKLRFDAIVVWRFDRFVRSTKHLLWRWKDFGLSVSKFINYQENINTNSPLGKALFTIVSAVAQLELWIRSLTKV